MYDAHYDLLSILYVLKDNKKYLKELIRNINNNLIGLNANLYFMNKKEMEYELGINSKIDVTEMFKKSVSILKNFNIRPKILFSIEGCDYIKDEEELEGLHSLGLKAILLVWNNENKYGSGIRSEKGLTEKGKSFIKKAIDLNMGIDLSHTNEKTFYDIIEIIKKSDKKVLCYASHSNIYDICTNPRNLKKEQLIELNKVGGYIGLVMHPPFITESEDYEEIKKTFLKHIKYASEIMGIDKVMLASDNLEFYDQLKVERPANPFKQKSINSDIRKLLKKEFTEEEIKKIMYKNALKIYERLAK